MASADSGITIHMPANLDGFIARRGENVDWPETSDQFAERLRNRTDSGPERNGAAAFKLLDNVVQKNYLLL
jgi:hypothetical protein